MVADCLGKEKEDFVRFGPDRPHNDSRYGMRGNKLRSLGWQPKRALPDDIAEIAAWYRANLHLYNAVSEPAVMRSRSSFHLMRLQRLSLSGIATAIPAAQATR